MNAAKSIDILFSGVQVDCIRKLGSGNAALKLFQLKRIRFFCPNQNSKLAGSYSGRVEA